VLTPVRVQVKRGGIRYIAARLIGNNGDVIADLALVRIALEGVKRIAHRNISRPGHAGVSAKGIEKLGVSVIGSISRVIPDRIKPSVRSYRKCAEPVPLAGINRIVMDLVRRAEG